MQRYIGVDCGEILFPALSPTNEQFLGCHQSVIETFGLRLPLPSGASVYIRVQVGPGARDAPGRYQLAWRRNDLARVNPLMPV